MLQIRYQLLLAVVPVSVKAPGWVEVVVAFGSR